MTALMLALLALKLLVQLVLVLAVVLGVAAVVWVLWDCTAGPSSHLAAAQRARDRAAVREVHSR